MIRGIQSWGFGLSILVTLIIFPNFSQAKSNDQLPVGSDQVQIDLGNDFAKKYLTKTIKVRVIRLCNDDESDAGQMTLYHANKGIEEANRVLYDNSGANILYQLDPETDLSTCVPDTLMNYDCFLNHENFAGMDQRDITAQDLATITESDLNGDGKYDKYDVQQLCDTSFQGVRRKNLSYDYIGSLVVMVRGLEARRRVQYNEDLGHWEFVYPSGGYSSCAGNLVIMNSGWWGNLLAHETGHYLCNPHTFGRRASDVDQAEAQIAAVINKYNLDPLDKTKVLNWTYDGDTGKVDFLGDQVILDTPPDPGPNIWKSVFGDDLCAAENDTIPVTVDEFGETYNLQPDRSLVMSYFKGCTGLDQHFSPNQIDRMELSLQVHRKHLVNQDVVACYQTKYNGTNWQYMTPGQALNKKEYYLDQCQGQLDLEAIHNMRNKKFYPIEIPIPDPHESFIGISPEELEILEEIDLDIRLQELQLKNSFLPIQEGFQNHYLGTRESAPVTNPLKGFQVQIQSWFR